MEHATANTKQTEHGKGTAPHARPAVQSQPATHPAMEMQQQVGNQAMQQLLRAGIIHAKLSISQPDDPDEREADSTADRIMRSHAGASVAASACSCSGEEEMCDECRQKQAAPILRKETGSGPPSVSHGVLSRMRHSAGHPLDINTRSFFESRFRHDFSAVRIHTDSSAERSASDLRANAYALGSDIFFAAGKYAPGTDDGRRLLAHEMTHTVQQSRSGAESAESILQRQNVTVGRTHDPMEAEADRVADSVMRSPEPATANISTDRARTVRGNWLGDAWDSVSDAGSWVVDKAEDAGEYVVDKAEDAGEWIVDKAEDAGEFVADKTIAAGKWFGNKAEEVGEWAWGKMQHAWNCLKATGHAVSNVVTGDVHSLTDLLGIPAPEGADPSTLDTVIAVLKHPCLQMIPGYGLLSGAVGILEKAGKFLVGAYHLLQNPQPVIDGIQKEIGKMMAAIPAYVESVVKKALEAVGSKAKEHGEGVWRHLEPKLAYLAKNWWDVIKQTGWNLLWPWPSVGKDLGECWDHLKSAGKNIWNLNFSKAIDDVLAIGRSVNNILGSLYGWFFIASVLVGTIIGAFFGGAGAIPGFWAGAAFAGEVGEALVGITVGIESASILKAGYNLLAQKETQDEKERDYEQIASSSLTLAITGIMLILGELAVKFAQGILSRAGTFIRKFGTEVEDVAASASKTAKGELPESTGPKSDVTTDAAPETKAGEPTERKGVEADEPADGMDPATGEPVEKLPDGEARVTEDGKCEICHSPCRFTSDMLKEVGEHLQRVRDALKDASSAQHFAQMENLLRRLQLLEDAMSESAARGQLKAEFNTRFRESFRRLSLEADAAYGDLFDPHEFSSDAAREIDARSPDEPGSEFNDPKNKFDPEKALEGTAFHEVIEGAVVQELPPGTAFTENTIQDFFRQRGVTGKGIPKRSSGIDLYVIDRVTGRVTPVDITGVAGGVRHVGKLIRNFEDVSVAFEKAGFTMSDPIEIEYVGQNFDEAARNVANELRAFAR
jgi:hypothetical protein